MKRYKWLEGNSTYVLTDRRRDLRAIELVVGDQFGAKYSRLLDDERRISPTNFATFLSAAKIVEPAG